MIADRISYKRAVGEAFNGKVIITKGMKYTKEEKMAKDEHKVEKLNPVFGFRCLKYSASEACGSVDIVVENKLKKAGNVSIRTKDGTAEGR